MKLSVTLKLSILLGLIQIIDYSISDIRIKSAMQFCRVAVMFTLIGYNIPKVE